MCVWPKSKHVREETDFDSCIVTNKEKIGRLSNKAMALHREYERNKIHFIDEYGLIDYK